MRIRVSSRLAIAALLLALSTIATTGCESPRVDKKASFKNLFEGYKLASVDDFPTGISEMEIERHVFPGNRAPEDWFVAGRVYVFRKTREVDEIIFATSILPRRLQDAGIKVVRHPQSEKEFLHPFTGPPLFRIDFELNGKKGMILNRTQAKDDGPYEDLLVVYNM